MAASIPDTASQPRNRAGILANVTLSIALALLGWFASQWRELIWPKQGEERIVWEEMGMDMFQQLSYDIPFVIRDALPTWLGRLASPVRSTDNTVLLYMDEESTRRLQQSTTGPWRRDIHARLLDRLTEEGARAVVFDVVFDSETIDDSVFADALRRNGHAFLGAAFSTGQEAPKDSSRINGAQAAGFSAEQLTHRNKLLYGAARGWGLLTFRPLDSDYGVRRLYTGKPRDGFGAWPSISWTVAKSLTKRQDEELSDQFERRWLNYFGPARQIESMGYSRALLPDGGVPSGYFKDRLVFIGGRSQLAASTGHLLDEFSTPWSRFRGRVYTPGAEIHATATLNLLHHDWLVRLNLGLESSLVILVGLALGGLRWLRPWPALGVASVLALLILGCSCLLQWRNFLWWNWTVPVFLQIPLGAGLAVASRYYIEETGKRKLRNAFGFYLSPALAREIAERNFNLAPGGEKVVATMVFTDLEGFTSLSEKLGDSTRLGAILTDYFTRTTDEILAEDGTVIKFIGDAVFAAWGVPLPQEDHAERAVRAAWRLAKVSETDVAILQPNGSTDTVHVRTRIGIHTGEALAGNLGSARRFDYTLIGDAVNFAARLEGANKFTGTTILLSDETVQQVKGKFLVRRLGAFKVKGKTKAVPIYELLGEDPDQRPPWLELFETALTDWSHGDLEKAAAGFNAVKQFRGGKDGPSQFYLDRIKTFHQGRLHAMTLAPIWNSEVELDSK